MKVNTAVFPEALIRLAIMTAAGQTRGLASPYMEKALKSLPRKKIVETLLEVHLFSGFPSSIEGFIALAPILSSRRTDGRIGGDTRAIRKRQGERLCKAVYGKNYKKLMLNMHRLNPDLAEWMIEDGYGKVLSRPGLTPAERELIAICVLAYGGWMRQLHSHVLGALNLGVSPDLVRATMRRAFKYMPQNRISGASTVLNRSLRGTIRRKKT